MKPRVILIDGYDETRLLSRSLIEQGFLVTAINKDMVNCEKLAEIKDLLVFNGDGSKPFVLEDASIYGADVAIAMSEHDDANLVICELCKKKFNVKKTIALIADPNKTEFFLSMGIDSVVCAISAISEIIEQHVFLDDITSIMPIVEGKATVFQVQVPEDASLVGKHIWETELPDEVLIGCIMRGSKSIIPKGDTCIAAGDELIVFATDTHKEAAIRQLTKK